MFPFDQEANIRYSCHHLACHPSPPSLFFSFALTYLLSLMSFIFSLPSLSQYERETEVQGKHICYTYSFSSHFLLPKSKAEMLHSIAHSLKCLLAILCSVKLPGENTPTINYCKFSSVVFTNFEDKTIFSDKYICILD